MVNQKELRLGNKIMYKGEVRTVNMIHDNGYAMGDIRGGYYADGNHKHYDPIPLTPEILEKCGFVFDTVTYQIGNIMLSECDGYFNFWLNQLYQGSIRKIYSLHQLQNLFYALTGQELEIK